MRLEFYNARDGETNQDLLQNGRLVFAASRSATIHSTETVKIHTDLIVKVPSGYVLTINTAPELHARTAELVPGSLVISHLDKEKHLEFMVRNTGRSTLVIQPKQIIAVGFVLETTIPEILELTQPPVSNTDTDTTRKVPTIKFQLT